MEHYLGIGPDLYPFQRKNLQNIEYVINDPKILCFRYRAAAIIIENGCVFMAGNEKISPAMKLLFNFL